MINENTIRELKSQYGDEIYSVTVGKQECVFRALTSAEYKAFSKMGLSSADLEDIIVMNAVVYPHPFNFNKIKPGEVSALADDILNLSGFASIDQALLNLEEARAEASGAIEMMKAFILATMPTYSYEELDGYTLKYLSKLVAMAEVILEIQSGVARGEDLKITLGVPEEQTQQEPKQNKTFDFTIDDIERANRSMAKDSAFKDFDAPPTDPIAQKLWQALQ